MDCINHFLLFRVHPLEPVVAMWFSLVVAIVWMSFVQSKPLNEMWHSPLHNWRSESVILQRLKRNLESPEDFADREDHVSQILSEMFVNTDNEITSLEAPEPYVANVAHDPYGEMLMKRYKNLELDYQDHETR